jgi:hypothetical protein
MTIVNRGYKVIGCGTVWHTIIKFIFSYCKKNFLKLKLFIFVLEIKHKCFDC